MEALFDTLPAPFGILCVDKMKLVFGVFSLSVFLGVRDWLYHACLWASDVFWRFVDTLCVEYVRWLDRKCCVEQSQKTNGWR